MRDLRVSLPKPCAKRWEDMTPRGCNRHCEQCEQIIHDLSQLTLDEAERLLVSGAEVCVRACVAPDGSVELKGGASGGARRMVAAIGASVGILAASPAVAGDGQKLGAIKGEVLSGCWGGRVSATAADGRVYYAKVGVNGRYKVKRLPAGSYDVTFVDPAPEAPNGSADQTDPHAPSARQVVVEPGRTAVADVADPRSCIIVGVMSIDKSNS